MLNLIFDPFPLLITQRLILREVTLEDTEQIFIQRSHPVINKYIHRTLAVIKEDAEQFIRMISKQQKNNESVTWAITEKNNNLLIGTICFWNINPINSTAEVGYGLHPDFYKKGIMSEAMNAVLKYGFKEMNVFRIDAFTNKNNLASLNLLARHGFNRNAELEHAYEDKTELEYNQIFSLENKLIRDSE